MFVHLILAIISVSFIMQVQTIKTSCFSIYSEDNKELESLTWVVGVPNITVVILPRESFIHHVILLELKKIEKITRFAYMFRSGGGSINATLANVSSNVLNKTMYNLTVTFLKPDLIDGHNISAASGMYECGTTTPIQLKHCPKPNDIVNAKTTQLFRYNDQASIQCNTVFVDNVNEDVIGRNFNLTCGARAKWIGQRPKCWNGSFLDLIKGNLVQTFKQGVKVLMFCDVINPTMAKVAILGSKQVYYNGTKMAWAYLHFSNADNNRIVTCYQSSVTSQENYQRSVKLNILYPPIIDKVYERSILLYHDGYVEIGFKSNPPISGSNAVTVTKHGSKVGNSYITNEDHLNKIVIHFRNASHSDLGEYNVTINSGPPFNTSQHFLVRVSARIPQAPSTWLYGSTSAVPSPQANTSVPLSSLLVVTILLIISLVVLIIGALKHFRVLCFKGKESDEPSVRFNKDDDIPGQVENVGNYEVPIVGNPYKPNHNQASRPQGSNYQHSSKNPHDKSAYDFI